jgi:membrane-bound lytic murein transglycosylase B
MHAGPGFCTLGENVMPRIEAVFLTAALLISLGGHDVHAQAAAATTDAAPAADAASAPAAIEQDAAFQQWLGDLRIEARAKGVSDATLDTALRDVKLIEKVIKLDRKQPEFTQTFWRYLDLRVNDKRITRGRELLRKHRKLLNAVWKKYGVQPRFLVSFWGLESNFGDHFGGYPVVQALVTLAYDPRRARFFRVQLLEALQILDRGDISHEQMKGSWAGAMGHLQFIPSTFIRYAVDGDGDGRRDIWNSLPDVFESAANYLSKIGWKDRRSWGREIRLPKNFNYDLASLDIRKPLAAWQKLGVRRIDGRALPKAAIDAAVVLPAGHKGPAFLVYDNFYRILNWNRSVLYALAVGHLADRYGGIGPLQGKRPAQETPLSRDMIKEMQDLLGAQGYRVGTPDGVVGPLTRSAIRAFQKTKRLPADGFPSADLLDQLRGG